MKYGLVPRIVLVVSITLTIATAALGQKPPASDLADTFWAGTDSAGESFVLELQRSGKIRFTPQTGVTSKGKWEVAGDRLTAEFNGRKLTLTANLESKQLVGEVLRQRTLKTTFTASQLPKVVSSIAPGYSAVAKAARQSGNVIVELTINQEGSVASGKVVTGPVLLSAFALAAARKWKFAPATENEPERNVRLSFAFRIASERESRRKIVSPVYWSPYQVQVVTPEIHQTVSYAHAPKTRVVRWSKTRQLTVRGGTVRMRDNSRRTLWTYHALNDVLAVAVGPRGLIYLTVFDGLVEILSPHGKRIWGHFMSGSANYSQIKPFRGGFLVVLDMEAYRTEKGLSTEDFIEFWKYGQRVWRKDFPAHARLSIGRNRISAVTNGPQGPIATAIEP